MLSPRTWHLGLSTFITARLRRDKIIISLHRKTRDTFWKECTSNHKLGSQRKEFSYLDVRVSNGTNKVLLSSLDLWFMACILHVCGSSLRANGEICVHLQWCCMCIFSCVSLCRAMSSYSKVFSTVSAVLFFFFSGTIKETEGHLVSEVQP